MTRGGAKPLIVLAGWLGCQKRSLRRYERLFKDHGCQTLSRIASPNMVVESCFQEVPPPPLQCPQSRWPIHEHGQTIQSMQEFSWDILREVHNRDCHYWIFYAFSNGGCFVWEQVQRILVSVATPTTTSRTENLDEKQRIVIQNLQQRLNGVIFDSCPSRQLAGVGHALALCSVKERTEVMMSHGMDVAFFPNLLAGEKRERANRRGESYYNGLRNDPSTIPSLFLYSQSDPLIPSQGVDELFEHRRALLGANRVFRRKFDTSRHCAHYIDNSEEYVTAVQTFMEVCRPNSMPLSKL